LAAGFARRCSASWPCAGPGGGLFPSAIAWSVLAALVVLTGASGLFAQSEVPAPADPPPSAGEAAATPR
jgi:hypothetical protein